MIDWKGIQVSQFDSQNISILNIVDNGGDAEITGVEGDLRGLQANARRFSLLRRLGQTELVYKPAFAASADEGTMLPRTPEVQSNVMA